MERCLACEAEGVATPLWSAAAAAFAGAHPGGSDPSTAGSTELAEVLSAIVSAQCCLPLKVGLASEAALHERATRSRISYFVLNVIRISVTPGGTSFVSDSGIVFTTTGGKESTV